jgi:excisionase family DNA binding protein
MRRKEVNPVGTPIERQTYSVEEAAQILGISRSLAYECVKTGEIPSVRFGSRIVIPVHVVEGLIEAA